MSEMYASCSRVFDRKTARFQQLFCHILHHDSLKIRQNSPAGLLQETQTNSQLTTTEY